MRPETYFSAVILFIAAFSVVYGVFLVVQPGTVMDPETKKPKKLKAALYAGGIALVFTLVTAYLSEKIDARAAGEKLIPRRKKKN